MQSYARRVESSKYGLYISHLKVHCVGQHGGMEVSTVAAQQEDPPSGRGLSVRSLHVLPKYFGFLRQSKDMQYVEIG